MTTSAQANGAASSGTMARALKEGLFAGVLSLGLFILYIGIKTDQNMANELVWYTRPGLLAVFVGIAAVGRFALVAFVYPWLSERKEKKSAAMPVHDIDAKPSFFKTHFLKIALVALILYPPVIVALSGTQGALKYVDNFGIQILIYVMLAWGLNIVVGLAGLLDLGYVAFYAVGAYSYALLAQNFGLSFWILLPLAGILAAFWGIILGFPVLRLKGDYLAIVTLAFGEIIRLVLINWQDVTKGTFGISSIPKATLFGIPFDASAGGFAKTFGLPMSSAYYKIYLFYVILALCCLTAYVTIRLRRMPIGRAWEALREDEIACRSLGINTVTTKLTAFAIGAMFGGFAGSFFAARQGFVSPESFVFLESAVILAIVVLGGMGSLTGIAVAAIVMIGGTEALREMEFLKHIFGEDFTPELYRMLLFGLAMVVVMLFKPRGFVGSREPTAFLKERKAVSGSFTKEGHG
ncbi:MULTISPECIES: high-affinity branched-chain amino acid ABC transporter permease LivM [Rhizobium]|uniref:Branched-chain amino acid ABC transporter permease n=1 Tax=Rhizobium wuzhouense TaxID=1986026 RepID=A0ABX5NR05_9HYPH|nr:MULTISPECIES: high-affinity branched-chain amino acid ABC transporter permease LivM [Rhizobium]PYB73220.1 branched-chain amino acid ABC transporter permease [Rhizobium wuzhouense]RKE83921.1 general L-amino acid ABC transporter membrane protein [Rhizobium sp. AG855]